MYRKLLAAIILVALIGGSQTSLRVIAATSVTDIGNPDAYTCAKSGFITFENLPDGTNLSAGAISGVQFTTTNGYTWQVGDFLTGNYNGRYPNGFYTSQGNHWAWLGPNEGSGRIDFPNGSPSYFSLLVSDALTQVSMDAYDANGNLLETAGPAPLNGGTGHMAQLAIQRTTRDIHHIVVHDSGNFFIVDAVCTDAVSVPTAQVYRLPWAGGNWTYTNGPHGSSEDGPNALDVQPLPQNLPTGASCSSLTGAKVDTNDWVYPIAPGTVTGSQPPGADGGNNNIGANSNNPVTLIITDANGNHTYYTHIADSPLRKGSQVLSNTPLGHPSCFIEHLGMATGIHAHFALQNTSDPNIMLKASFCGWQLLSASSNESPLARNGISVYPYLVPNEPHQINADNCPTPGAANRTLDSTQHMNSGDSINGQFNIDYLAGAPQSLSVGVGPFGSDVNLTLFRPDGSIVAPTDTGVQFIKTASSISEQIDAVPPGQWTYSLTGNQLEPGGEDIRIVAEESNGAGPSPDIIAPVTNANAMLSTSNAVYAFGTWTNQSVQITLNAADNPGGSGIAQTYYSVDNAACIPSAVGNCTIYSGSRITMGTEGNHTLTYFSVDNAGNAEAVMTEEIQIDLTPPITVATATLGTTTNPYPFATWTNQPVQVTLNAADDSGGSGVAHTYYAVDNPACTPTTLASCTIYGGSPFAVSAEGNHELTYFSVDNAGNSEAAKIAVIQIDVTPPNPPTGSVSPAPNPAGWNNTPATVSFAGNGDAGVAAAQSGVVSCTAPTTVSSETVGTAVSGTCTDAAGNTSTATSVTVKLDATAPHSTATLLPAPNAAGWNKGTVQVTLTAADAGSGVQSLHYGASGAQTIVGTNVAGTATLSITKEGQTTVTYAATDVAGNLEATESTVVKIDKTHPSCALTGTGVNGSGQKYIQITVQDAVSGIGSIVTTTLNNDTMPTTFTAGTTSPVVLTATKIDQSQAAQVGLQVTDLAGNVTNCDPVMTDLIRDSSTPSTIRATHLTQGEHLLHIYNGDPGLSHLIVRVNGVKVNERDLAPNEQRTVDISSALQPGDNNTVTVIARGKQRGQATLVIADS